MKVAVATTVGMDSGVISQVPEGIPFSGNLVMQLTQFAEVPL